MAHYTLLVPGAIIMAPVGTNFRVALTSRFSQFKKNRELKRREKKFPRTLMSRNLIPAYISCFLNLMKKHRSTYCV